MEKLRALVLKGCVLFVVTSTAWAEEGGSGHVSPGDMATLIDMAPNKAGWVVESIYVNYDGSFSRNSDIPIGGVTSLGLKVNVDALTVGALYTLDSTLWGAYFSFGAFVPYSAIDVEGKVNDLEVQDSVQGIGDIAFVPLMLAWTDDFWQYNASVTVFAPTGDYNAGDLANLGLNYWTADSLVNMAYSNPDTGFNFTAFMGITLNSENNATDYKSGSMFHLESSMTQLFSIGPGYLGLGVDAYYFKQVTSDSGSGAIADFKGKVMGIGPVLNYILPAGDNNWVFEAKWLPESNVENRLKGDYISVKVVYQFE